MCLVVDGQTDDGGQVCLWVVGKQRKDEPFPVVELKCGGNAKSLHCVVVSNVRNTDLAQRSAILHSPFVSELHYGIIITTPRKFKTAPRVLICGFIFQRYRQAIKGEVERSDVLSEELKPNFINALQNMRGGAIAFGITLNFPPNKVTL